MSILLLRHATTDANIGSQKLVRGQLDYPINDSGRQDAEDNATRLKALQDDGVNFRRILCCDLLRTRQTIAPLAKQLGLPVHYTPMLRTWKLGPDFEGQPITQELSDRIRQLVLNPNRVPYEGESYASHGARLSSFAQPFLHDRPDEGIDIFATHGQPIRYYNAWMAAGGKGLKYDPRIAADATVGAEHTGLALMAPGRFEYIDPKPSTGLS